MSVMALYNLSRTGRAMVLAVILCQVFSGCHGQDFSKITKLRDELETHQRKMAEVMMKDGLPTQLQGRAQSELAVNYSLSCRQGMAYLWNHTYTNYFKMPLPMFFYAADALGKPGAGFLEGNAYAFGSYDECLDLEHTKYCVVPVNASNFTISVGACVPEGCNKTDSFLYVNSTFAQLVESVLKVDISINISKTSEVKCNSGKPSYSAGAIVMIAVSSLFAALVVASTVTDWVVNVLAKLSIPPLRLLINNEPENTGFDVMEKAPLLSGTAASLKRSFRHSVIMDFLTAFSLFKVVPMVLSTKQPSSAITSVNGIRVISMFWVILGHTQVWVLGETGADNIAYIYGRVVPRFSFQAIINGTFSVDSFFFLSGLLMAYLTLRKMSRNGGRFPVLIYYVHRLLRLTPTYAFLLFFYWFLTVQLGTGPRYLAETGPGSAVVENCEKYWWTNLLYINNLHPWKLGDECMGWTWYLANDMQFFVVAPLMVIPLYYCLPLGFAIVAIFLAGNFASIAGIVGYYGFDAAILANNPGPTTPGDELYVKPYVRISPYLVGIILGYLLYRKVRFPFHLILNWACYLLVWVVGAACLFAPVYGLYDTWHGHSLSEGESILYFTFSRFSWGVGLALVVFACHNGYGWFINSFLSMKVWVPLSRLTFTAYLVHEIVLSVVFGYLRSPVHYTDMIMAVLSLGCVVLAYGAAALVAVFVEFPLANVESAIFKAFGLEVRESARQVTDPTRVQLK